MGQDKITPSGWLEWAHRAGGDPESIAIDWCEFLNCRGLAWRAYEDWVDPVRDAADADFDEFRVLMWRAWSLFSEGVDSSTTCGGEAVRLAPCDCRYLLRLYAALSAYSLLYDEASGLYDRRYRYRDILPDNREAAERAEAPLLRFMASTIAARCLCEAVESGVPIESPILEWEGQASASSYVWPLKRAHDARTGEFVGLVLCKDAAPHLVDAVEGGRLRLAEGSRSHLFHYDVECGDLAPIVDVLKSFYIGENLEPMWVA